MQHITYKGYRIRLHFRSRWSAFVYKPGEGAPFQEMAADAREDGLETVLELAKARIEEDIIDRGGAFLDG